MELFEINTKVFKAEVCTTEWAIAMKGLTVLAFGGMWKTLGHWTKKVLESWMWSWMGHCGKSLKDINAKIKVDYEDPTQDSFRGEQY